MSPDAFIILVVAVLGALVGSFTNVLIYRLPRHESIAFPPSHCPNCDHRLGPLDLVPVLSWAALRGRCRYCRAPINPRYPVVELISAAGYAAIAAAFPLSQVGLGLVGLLFLFTVLLAGSFIDAETYTLPDELTLPAVFVGLLFGYVHGRAGGVALGLPDFGQALQGALMGAGVLATVNLFGAWVLRRFRERAHPEFPINYQQIGLAALVGAWLGVTWGVLAGLASVAMNAVARRTIRVPEALTLGGLLLSLLLGAALQAGPGIIGMVQGALAAAGGVALLAGLYWWTRPEPDGDEEDDDHDPEAMGFGDVKLAAAIGAFLGWEKMLLAIGIAVVVGALLGVVQLAVRRENRLKFGPFLAVGAVVALLWGQSLISSYLKLLGLEG